MNFPTDALLKLSAGFLETGFMAMKAGAQTMQAGLEALAGPPSDAWLKDVPVNGPQTLDTALAELANQAIRIGRLTPPEGDEIVKAAGELVRSARRSFGYLKPGDPRLLLLPFTAPLSAIALLSDSMLAATVAYSVLGPQRIPSFMSDALEMFSEVNLFVSLQYKELSVRHRERLEREPDDSATRLELGRVCLKCGLYDDAIRELGLAAKDPATRAVAMHESAVAQYRAGRFAEAVADGVEAMNANPANERARYWMWMASRSLGGYPDSVPVKHRMEAKTGYARTSIQFEEIAAKIGLDKTSGGRGSAIFDYNNDGLMDIVLAAAYGGCSLYRNNGDGTFTDVSVGCGLDQCINAFSVTAGDYDNDGFVDLYVTRLGFYSGDGTLYHNNGDGTFTDVTAQAGVQHWGPTFTSAWVDYDCDGYLDLFITNNISGIFGPRVPNRLFHNNGNGTFTEVTETAGLHTVFPTIGSAWGDYDNDGYPDLFASSGLGRPQLFHNNHDGTFTDVGKKAGFTDFVVGSVSFWCDYDNDGWLDLVQYSWSDHEDVVTTMKTGHGPADGSATRVYHNNRDGTFTMVSRELGIDGCWGTMSGSFGDVNNDGYIDFILGNGSPRMDRSEPLVVLESDGKRYNNVTFSAGLPFSGKSHGANCADLFGDGRLTIVVASGGAYPGELLTTSVFRPKERMGNYLNVRVTGTKSNRDGIGARITLFTDATQQMREVGGGTNFGCLPPEQHFGLGKLTEVDALEIRWPGGARQRVENPPVNSTIRVTEGRPGWESVYAVTLPNPD